MTTTETPEHEDVRMVTGSRSGLTLVIAVHDTTLGPAFGGCRLWTYPSADAAVDDALRLARGMTAKNALAGLPNGGGKSVIRLPAGELFTAERRRDAFLDFGDAVAAFDGRYLTAEDVGTTTADMAVVRERTEHVVGTPVEHGGLGNPAPYTARGVIAAMRETTRRAFGSRDFVGLHFAIAGLGQVGTRLAEQLIAEGATLTVSDLDEGRREYARSLGAGWASADAVHRVEADVFVPAGVGGMLSSAVIRELGSPTVVGPANNQLADESCVAELADRGVLYAPDYLANAGGVIYLGSADGTGMPAVLERIDGIEATLHRVFDIAEQSGVTSSAAADALVADILRESRTGTKR